MCIRGEAKLLDNRRLFKIENLFLWRSYISLGMAIVPSNYVLNS